MSFALVIVTPEGKAFEDCVQSVVLPGSEGDFGVLAGHEPFLTALRIGAVEIDTGETKIFAALSRGYAEVHGDTVTVMASTCEFADEIDTERAEVSQERARRMLEEMRSTAEGEDAYRDYQDAYSKAITRVSISKKFR